MDCRATTATLCAGDSVPHAELAGRQHGRTLARVRRQQRPRYGFYVDHMADIFGAVALMCGLGCSGFLHWQTAVAMLVAFLLLSSESYLATYTLTCFQLSQGIFGPTEIRILLIIGNLRYCAALTRRCSAQDAAV